MIQYFNEKKTDREPIKEIDIIDLSNDGAMNNSNSDLPTAKGTCSSQTTFCHTVNVTQYSGVNGAVQCVSEMLEQTSSQGVSYNSAFAISNYSRSSVF